MNYFKITFATIICILYSGLLFFLPDGSQYSGVADGICSAFQEQLPGQAAVKITFNDPRLELAVRNALDKPIGDINDTDMTTLTFLEVKNDSIADLTGLEYAVNLQELDLYKNRLSDLTPLQNLTGLELLAIGNNQISDISPLADLVNLTFLSLKTNEITDLTPLQNLVNLVRLELQDNPIIAINGLQNLTALKSLYLSNCKITGITPLQNLQQLDYLSITGNKINDITPLQNLTALTVLRLIDNKITDITPLHNLTALEELSLSRNEIPDFTPLLDLTNLEILYLTETCISDLSVLQNMAALQQLYIANNHVRDLLPLQAFTALKILECYNNDITDLSGLQNLPALERVDIGANRISDLAPLGTLPVLKNLDISTNKIKDLASLPDLPVLEILSLSDNLLDHSDLPALYKLDKLKTLRLRNNPGILSGKAVQTLADSLNKLDCDDIVWDGECGVDPNAAAICWVDPDTAEINKTVTALATATDVNHNRVQIKIDWGDGQVGGYSNLQATAALFTFTHSYTGAGTFYIKAKARNESGAETYWCNEIKLVIIDSGTKIRDKEQFAHGYNLQQNYPNPFNASTTIRYTLPQPGHVLLRIVNLAGQETARLLDAVQPAGAATIVWDGTNAAGEILPSGVYIIHIEAGPFTRARKMILLR